MKSPAFQFYPDDFVGGVADMTQAEVGAYILLLCAQWGRGEIPLDPERAALIAKGPVPSHVMKKFPGGKNPRLEVVRAALEAYRAAQADNGAKGADKRWGRHTLANGVAMAPPSPENGGAIISPMARNSSPTPAPFPTPTPAPPSGSAQREGAVKLPDSINTAPMRAAWEKWQLYLIGRRGAGCLSIPIQTLDAHLEILRKLGAVNGVLAIDHAIEMTWAKPGLPSLGYNKPAPPEKQRWPENIPRPSK